MLIAVPLLLMTLPFTDAPWIQSLIIGAASWATLYQLHTIATNQLKIYRALDTIHSAIRDPRR